MHACILKCIFYLSLCKNSSLEQENGNYSSCKEVPGSLISRRHFKAMNNPLGCWVFSMDPLTVRSKHNSRLVSQKPNTLNVTTVEVKPLQSVYNNTVNLRCNSSWITGLWRTFRISLQGDRLFVFFKTETANWRSSFLIPNDVSRQCQNTMKPQRHLLHRYSNKGCSLLYTVNGYSTD